MRDELRSLMDAILNEIDADEASAQELAGMAHHSEQDGDAGTAQTLRALGRNHRVKSMVGLSRLAALSIRYAHILDGG